MRLAFHRHAALSCVMFACLRASISNDNAPTPSLRLEDLLSACCCLQLIDIVTTIEDRSGGVRAVGVVLQA